MNKIRELPQHPQIVVTHTDAPELYVWNTDTQPDAGGRGVSGPTAVVEQQVARIAGLQGWCSCFHWWMPSV